ncbi:hypothetical protein [Clostridium sp.]|uniref:hypothetical protein n=1 Tax=Clostridium sp. TaxID=1506 RepID=UPI001A5C9C9D|nr:hypothetical protein [Clostridium sp.]MBK5240234.1 hypothetical protein [Clostridium sp.]
MVKNKVRNSSGKGTIFLRKDGRYGAAVSLGKDENGKRIRPNVTGKTEEEAKEKMRVLLMKMELIDEEEISIITFDSKTLVEDFIKEFKKIDFGGTRKFQQGHMKIMNIVLTILKDILKVNQLVQLIL